MTEQVRSGDVIRGRNLVKTDNKLRSSPSPLDSAWMASTRCRRFVQQFCRDGQSSLTGAAQTALRRQLCLLLACLAPGLDAELASVVMAISSDSLPLAVPATPSLLRYKRKWQELNMLIADDNIVDFKHCQAADRISAMTL